MKQEKTSLEKSHSAWSNTKLTLLCILTIVGVTLFWGTLALKNVLPVPVFGVALGVSVVLCGVCVFMLNAFKR